MSKGQLHRNYWWAKGNYTVIIDEQRVITVIIDEQRVITVIIDEQIIINEKMWVPFPH